MPERMDALLALWDYRRTVRDNYRAVRVAVGGREAWEQWRRRRDELFAAHPQSPLAPDVRASFEGLDYFPYDDRWRFEAEVRPVSEQQVAVPHSGEGQTSFTAFGEVELDVDGTAVRLTLLWLTAYGGGVFLPFRDTTNGTTTYGGGRYLLDTVKGADLGSRGNRVVLDFNFAYHPSCAHNPRWSCPLAPTENWLDISVEAGERLREAGRDAR